MTIRLFILLIAILTFAVDLITSMIPATLWYWQAHFGWGPAKLSILASLSILSDIFFGFMTGFLAESIGKIRSLFIALALIILSGLLFSLADNFAIVTLGAIAAGASAGISTVSTASLISDHFEKETHGSRFSQLNIFMDLGALFGLCYMVLIAPKVFLGLPGWRIGYAFVTLLLVIFIIFIIVRNLNSKKEDAKEIPLHQASETLILTKFKDLVKNKMILSIYCVEVLESIGWAFIAYWVLWLQLIGFKGYQLLALVMAGIISRIIAWMIAGKVSDWIFSRYGQNGRIHLFQMSLFIGMFMGYILFSALPKDSSYFLAYLVVMSLQGLLSYWTLNSTLISGYLNKDLSGPGFSFLRLCMLIGTSLGLVLVGLISENVFNYHVERSTVENFATALQPQVSNAIALAKSLLLVYLFSNSLSILIYFYLLKYPRKI